MAVGTWVCREILKFKKFMMQAKIFLISGSQNNGLHSGLLKFLRFLETPRSLQPLRRNSEKFKKFMMQAKIFLFRDPKTLACIINFFNFQDFSTNPDPYSTFAGNLRNCRNLRCRPLFWDPKAREHWPAS